VRASGPRAVCSFGRERGGHRGLLQCPIQSGVGRADRTVGVQPLAAELVAAEAGARELMNLAGASSWSTLSEPERLAYATAVSPNPFSDAVVALVRARTATPPVVRERLRNNDRILELGCGVAGQILCTLRAFPDVTAVAVSAQPTSRRRPNGGRRRLGLPTGCR
jgi:hypothetical protein